MPKRNDLEQKALHYVVGTGYQGVLQSDLWRELGASSREGSRVSIKLEEKGLIRREKEPRALRKAQPSARDSSRRVFRAAFE